MTSLPDRLRAAIDAEEVRLHALPPFPWKLNPDDNTEVFAADDVVLAEAWALSSNQQRLVAQHILAGSPERGLRRCAADRKILDLWDGTVGVRDIAWNKFRAGEMPTEAESSHATHAERELAALQVVLEALAEAYGVEEQA